MVVIKAVTSPNFREHGHLEITQFQRNHISVLLLSKLIQTYGTTNSLKLWSFFFFGFDNIERGCLFDIYTIFHKALNLF